MIQSPPKKIRILLIPNLPALCKERDSFLVWNGLFRNTRQQSSMHVGNFLLQKVVIISLQKGPHSFRGFICCWWFFSSWQQSQRRGGAGTFGSALRRASFLRQNLDNRVLKPQAAPTLPSHVAGVGLAVLVPLSETPSQSI